jgi:hypothetical protein
MGSSRIVARQCRSTLDHSSVDDILCRQLASPGATLVGGRSCTWGSHVIASVHRRAHNPPGISIRGRRTRGRPCRRCDHHGTGSGNGDSHVGDCHAESEFPPERGAGAGTGRTERRAGHRDRVDHADQPDHGQSQRHADGDTIRCTSTDCPPRCLGRPGRELVPQRGRHLRTGRDHRVGDAFRRRLRTAGDTGEQWPTTGADRADGPAGADRFQRHSHLFERAARCRSGGHHRPTGWLRGRLRGPDRGRRGESAPGHTAHHHQQPQPDHHSGQQWCSGDQGPGRPYRLYGARADDVGFRDRLLGSHSWCAPACRSTRFDTRRTRRRCARSTGGHQRQRHRDHADTEPATTHRGQHGLSGLHRPDTHPGRLRRPSRLDRGRVGQAHLRRLASVGLGTGRRLRLGLLQRHRHHPVLLPVGHQPTVREPGPVVAGQLHRGVLPRVHPAGGQGRHRGTGMDRPDQLGDDVEQPAQPDHLDPPERRQHVRLQLGMPGPRSGLRRHQRGHLRRQRPLAHHHAGAVRRGGRRSVRLEGVLRHRDP